MQNYLLYYNGKSNEMLRNSFIIHRVKFIMQEFFQTHSYLSQIFGFLAIAVGILMYQFKKHKTIMIFMTLYQMTYMVFSIIGIIIFLCYIALITLFRSFYPHGEKLELPYLFF